MILDSISHYGRYRGLSPRFARAFEYLKQLDPATADGRYEIEDELIYATVMSYETKVPANLTHEAHLHFADIQVLLEGEEVMYYTAGDRLGAGLGYVKDKDYEHFPQPVGPLKLVVRAGTFALFFPAKVTAPTARLISRFGPGRSS